MTVLAQLLVDMCASVGIGVDQLAAVEGADRLTHTFTVSGAAAAHLDAGAVQAVTAGFGAALWMEIRTGDLRELLVDPAVTDAQVATFVASAPAGGPYEVEIRVEKARLIPQLTGGQEGRNICFFLFAEGLARALARGLARFEQEVWPHAPAPLVIAVADTDIDLRGEHLSVLGGASLLEVATAVAAPAPHDRLAAITEARDRHVNWDGTWTAELTPSHFAVTGTCANDRLLGLFRAQVVKLMVLFTCDRARTRPGTGLPDLISAEFRSGDHAASVVIDESAPLAVSEDQSASAVGVVEWCYARSGDDGGPDWVVDRLPFVQARLAQALHVAEEQERVAVLIRVLPSILEGIEWQWKGFISGRVSEYLAQLQDVETAVADAVTSFADRSAALAKSVIDALLAALVVSIGSLIAAAFKDPFNATLFRIGILGYAAYLIVFPGAVGLSSSRYGMLAAQRSFDRRIERFAKTIDPAKVDEIVDDRVRLARGGFCRWLTVAAVIYLAVGVAAVAGAVRVPAMVADDLAPPPPSTTEPATQPSSTSAPTSTSGPSTSPPTTR